MAPVRCVLVLVLVGGACTVDASRPPPTPRTGVEAASFGPAGEALIAFHSDPAGSDDTYVMAQDGREVMAVTDGMHRLEGVSGSANDCCPAWRPDGSRT
jgi:Tol biopolymer transport system component